MLIFAISSVDISWIFKDFQIIMVVIFIYIYIYIYNMFYMDIFYVLCIYVSYFNCISNYVQLYPQVEFIWIKRYCEESTNQTLKCP